MKATIELDLEGMDVDARETLNGLGVKEWLKNELSVAFGMSGLWIRVSKIGEIRIEYNKDDQ